jgi:serine/threonine protein kinase
LLFAPKRDNPTIKILDFDLAKLTREQKVDTALTSQGQALGTPDVIAPEQIVNAQSADIRADIYSLGGTLYYLLAGLPPFEADSLYDMYQAHSSCEADRLNLVRPDVPADFAAFVAKLMAKEPTQWFQTPSEVADALSPCFKKGSQSFITTPTPETSRSGQVAPTRPSAVTPVAPLQQAANATTSADPAGIATPP